MTVYTALLNALMWTLPVGSTAQASSGGGPGWWAVVGSGVGAVIALVGVLLSQHMANRRSDREREHAEKQAEAQRAHERELATEAYWREKRHDAWSTWERLVIFCIEDLEEPGRSAKVVDVMASSIHLTAVLSSAGTIRAVKEATERVCEVIVANSDTERASLSSPASEAVWEAVSLLRRDLGVMHDHDRWDNFHADCTTPAGPYIVNKKGA